MGIGADLFCLDPLAKNVSCEDVAVNRLECGLSVALAVSFGLSAFTQHQLPTVSTMPRILGVRSFPEIFPFSRTEAGVTCIKEPCLQRDLASVSPVVRLNTSNWSIGAKNRSHLGFSHNPITLTPAPPCVRRRGQAVRKQRGLSPKPSLPLSLGTERIARTQSPCAGRRAGHGSTCLRSTRGNRTQAGPFPGTTRSAAR